MYVYYLDVKRLQPWMRMLRAVSPSACVRRHFVQAYGQLTSPGRADTSGQVARRRSRDGPPARLGLRQRRNRLDQLDGASRR